MHALAAERKEDSCTSIASVAAALKRRVARSDLKILETARLITAGLHEVGAALGAQSAIVTPRQTAQHVVIWTDRADVAER